MNLASNYIYTDSSNTHLRKLPFLSTKPFKAREFRVYRRRRLKPSRKIAVGNQIRSLAPTPFENLFNSLITQYPSVNSLDLIAPALGFASGVALYLSRLKSWKNSGVLDIGDWILFASPTPFNRFVFLRCPSISFQGSESLENVNEKPVKEERHFVTLNSGRIQVRSHDGGERGLEGGNLNYQRVCVTTKDGGVVSLDWPANLDLEEERGLDTTLLLVPGTPEGSMDNNIRSFVLEALKRGFFPVVMNPRGCAGSPLTTARLFTAADSDDICTAITYINTARPWTTLMGVGWGYGANMLTKYLAEFGERTPLTAATSIDNPFDLDEATRSSPYHIVVDQKLTSGLVDILRTNQELFRGKTKSFDVENALSAKSVRDFEKSISMVSYGFGAIEDFYSKSSTRNVIGSVKIPVLFIQSDDGMAPVFSIPRNLIAENPFTSLLLCSCVPSSFIGADRSIISWCQLLTIEWLTAVELGLLKGRHPLLTDLDVTIKTSKGLAVVEDIRPDKTNEGSKLLDLTQSDAFDGYSIDCPKNMLENSKNDANFQFRSEEDLQRNLELGDTSLQIQNDPLQQTSSTNPDVTEEENTGSIDGEHGQVLQTAQVVMNMLDVTNLDTLTEEKKKKVLTAVGQGETLMKALEDAVPEDVRGKLTAAVTGIMHSQGTHLKFDRVLGIAKAPDALSGPKNQEKMKGVSGVEGISEDQSSLNEMKRTKDSSDNAPSGTGVPAGGTESEVLPLDKSQKATSLAQSEATNNDEVGSSGSFSKETSESRSNDMNEQLEEKAAPNLGNSEKGLETGAKHTPSQHEGAGGGFEAGSVDEQKSENSGIAQADMKEEINIQKVAQKTQESSSDQKTQESSSNQKTQETSSDQKTQESSSNQKTQETSSDQSKMASTTTKEEPPSPPVSYEHQTVEREGNCNEKKENKNMQEISDQANSVSSDSSPAPFSVSQAFGALTGMDDSTQVAVNSVFGVIESMIDQFEESSDKEYKVKDGKEIEHELGEKQKTDNQITKSNTIDDPFVDNHNDGTYPQDDTCYMEEQPTQSLSIVNGSRLSNPQGTNSDDHVALSESKINGQLVGKILLADEWDGHGHVNRMPLYISASPYGYLISKVPPKSLDLDTTTTLLLDYIPEEGEWKLLEQSQNMESSSANIATCEDTSCKMKGHSPAKSSDKEQYIEPPYVILDTEKQPAPVKEFIATDIENEKIDAGDDRSEELIQFVKNIILDSLRVEVGRKLNATEMEEMKLNLAGDLEHVANAISLAIVQSKLHPLHTKSQFHNIEVSKEKVGTVDGEHIVRAISSAVQETSYLKRVMPVGVIVGSSLAALRKYFNVVTVQDNGQGGCMTLDDEKKSGKKNYGNVCEIDQVPNRKSSLGHSVKREEIKSESKDVNKNTVIVGAVTAALGASALLMRQQDPHKGNGTDENSSSSLKMKDNHQKESHKLEEVVSEKHQNNVVTSLAEKAMSVASPVVPTKEGGEVDQDRLVAMLANLGQRGGLLRLVGKIALLWGGIRGAMSLTDRLISFLNIAERPLFQRIFAFVGMVLVLWSPIAVPLLPYLVQSWTTHTPSRIAELACVIGLYTAIMTLVMLWGKRTRGYENPLEQYGLDMTSSPKILDFLTGLVGGIMLVFSIQAVNVSLGCASFSWPPVAPSLDVTTWLKVCGQTVMLVAQGTVMATAIALVEELFFRSWLPQEIAVDFGYHRGIIISGLAFSLFQRSLQSIPALWLLSLALSGARQRNGGNLAIPIGLRAGMLASNFILQKGGFLTYMGNFPPWITGTHPFQPFSGIVGLLFSFILALLLYPRQTSQKQEVQE